jgi:hypothetical protein
MGEDGDDVAGCRRAVYRANLVADDPEVSAGDPAVFILLQPDGVPQASVTSLQR